MMRPIIGNWGSRSQAKQRRVESRGLDNQISGAHKRWPAFTSTISVTPWENVSTADALDECDENKKIELVVGSCCLSITAAERPPLRLLCAADNATSKSFFKRVRITRDRSLSLTPSDCDILNKKKSNGCRPNNFSSQDSRLSGHSCGRDSVYTVTFRTAITEIVVGYMCVRLAWRESWSS